MKSIIQNSKECFFTGSSRNLDKHHIFFGNPDRKLSEKYGLWIWLEHERHIAGSPYKTPHNNRDIDMELKKIGQLAFELHYPETSFVSVFGKNYLDKEEECL